MDKKHTVYTACAQTGEIFCSTFGGKTVLYATVDETATALAVDHERIVYVGTQSGRIFAVRLDGRIDEVYRGTQRIVGIGIDRDAGLHIAMEDGTLVRVPAKKRLDSQP
ncbi:hypothetical protein GO013_08050 [Pseudodesulfovibrio sp. JC047]|uniref:hypothetical protein n=1 Tax=Pseudodesulfovibrio sp. JC047 TaxID=2683199 RepID=UPI0013D8D7F6|nr:hypothetical protein [Pseudodesulfovibrio sp. JC047]NDV19368.1 hypothetical protein [Pseudodesulfovibrio sp. JC047]